MFIQQMNCLSRVQKTHSFDRTRPEKFVQSPVLHLMSNLTSGGLSRWYIYLATRGLEVITPLLRVLLAPPRAPLALS